MYKIPPNYINLYIVKYAAIKIYIVSVDKLWSTTEIAIWPSIVLYKFGCMLLIAYIPGSKLWNYRAYRAYRALQNTEAFLLMFGHLLPVMWVLAILGYTLNLLAGLISLGLGLELCVTTSTIDWPNYNWSIKYQYYIPFHFLYTVHYRLVMLLYIESEIKYSNSLWIFIEDKTMPTGQYGTVVHCCKALEAELAHWPSPESPAWEAVYCVVLTQWSAPDGLAWEAEELTYWPTPEKSHMGSSAYLDTGIDPWVRSQVGLTFFRPTRCVFLLCTFGLLGGFPRGHPR